MRSLLRRIRFEPAVVTGLIVAVAAFFGVEVAEDQVAGSVGTAWQVGVAAVPLVQGLVTRLRTRSRASLEAEGYVEST